MCRLIDRRMQGHTPRGSARKWLLILRDNYCVYPFAIRKQCGRIGIWIRKGIRRMLEFSKRWGPYFLTAAAAFAVGTAPVMIFLKDSPCLMLTLVIIFSILAAICLISAIIALFYDLRDVCRREKEKKQETIYKALIESFKFTFIRQGKSDEEAQKMAEIAAAGSPPGPPIEGDEWVSPMEAYNKSCRKEK